MESQPTEQIIDAARGVKNPLYHMDLRETIHQPINEHATHYPAYFNPSLYPGYKLDYFYQFLLGVFSSIRGASDSGLKDIYMRKYKIANDADSLRIFAIYNDLIVLHDIHSEISELDPESKIMTKQEYSLLKDLIKEKHDLAIDRMSIKYKGYGAGLVETAGYWQMSMKHEMDVQVRDGIFNGQTKTRTEHMLLDEKEISTMISRKAEIHFLEIVGHSRFFDTFKSIDHKVSHLYMLEKGVQEADYVQKGLNNEHSVVPGAKPAFMHGLLSASMPDHYYNEALQFASKWKEFLIQVPSSLIFIPPIDPSDSKRIVLDYREFKTISDDYLMASRIGPQIELHFWQHSVEMGGQWTLQTEVIKWCSANIISNLVKEIKSFKPNGNLEVLEAKKKSYFDLLNIRRGIYELILSSNPDLRKYFLFGEFITSLEQKFHINAQNTEAATRLEAILMDHDETKVLLTFDANGPIVAHQDLQSIVHRRDSDVIGINFGREGELMFTISLNYATRAYAGFDTIFPTKMNRLFNEISFTDNSKIKQLPLLFRIVMDDLLKGAKNFATDNYAINAYFCGAFSKLKIRQWFSGQQNGGRLTSVFIKTARNLYYNVHLLLLNDATKQCSSEVMDLARRRPSPRNAFYLAYNFAERTFVQAISFQRDRLAVMAVAVNGKDRKIIEPYTSKRVVRHCTDLPRRRKRASATSIICPTRKKSGQGDKRMTYQDLEKRFTKKHPRLHRRVEKLYKIATRIQTSIIGGSMLSHLSQGDFKAFGIDVAFLGAAVASPYAAERIAKWGEKKAIKLVEKGAKSKGIIQTVMKKIGWRIATVGRCLPTLGFTAYSAYQLHQEIKANDSVSAAITGASLAIDIIGCGFEAAAAVGLLAISPIIVKIGLIVSTALAIVQNVYSGFRQTQEIGEVIPLTLSERFYSFKRSVIPWLDADPTLKSMADQVIANEQAVATAFYMFPEVNRFLLAAAIRVDGETGQVSYHEDNTMDMTIRKHQVQVSRVMPRQEKIGTDYRLFCAMDKKHEVGKEELKQKMSWSSVATLGLPEIVMAIVNHLTVEKRPEVDDYHCINAFGVNRVNNSSSDATIFLLHNGVDKVIGFQDSPNVIILGDGKKEIKGGQKDDHFVMIGNHAHGFLDGGAGKDVIDFSGYAKDPSIVMKFDNSMVSLSSEKQNFVPLIARNFENFVGRLSLTDHIKVCNHTSIDLRGTGSSSDPDVVIISDSVQCQPIKTLRVHLNNNTYVVCDAENATVIYEVTRDTSNFIDTSVGRHHFEFNLLTVTEVRATMNSTLLRLSIGSSGKLDIKTRDTANLEFTFDVEKITMTLNQGKLVARINNTASIYETVENYASYIDQNQIMELIVKTSHGNIKLSHDHSTIEKIGVEKNLNIIFFDDEEISQKLIGHSDGENYFLIHKKLDYKVDEAVDGLLNITIDATLAKNFVSYLDLKYFCAAREGNSEYDIKMAAVQDEDNIIITVFAVPVNNVDGVGETEVGIVTIIDGMTYMDQIRIHLWSESRIVNSSNELVIQPISVHVNQHTYSIHPDQLEFNSSVYFNFAVSNLEAYIVNNTLILTDVAVLEKQEANRVILTFIEFYIYKQKYETLVLIFKNRSISLNASNELVKMAVDISLMWRRMDERLDLVEEEEKEEKELNEYRNTMDKLEHVFSLRPE